MQQQQQQPLREVVTFEDFTSLDHCERLFEIHRTQPKQIAPPSDQQAAEAAGRAYHRAASTPSLRLRRVIIENALSVLPPADREVVRSEVIEMVRHADDSAVNEDAGMRREVQLLWTDPRTGWTFAAKPDLFDDSGDVIRIKEDKRSRRFYPEHRFQVWFAAFVAAQIEVEKQMHLPPQERKFKEIIMTVRCSRFIEVRGQKRRMWEQTFRFPLERLSRETYLMRRRVGLIKKCAAHDWFRPALEVGKCSTCPRRGECAALLRNPPLLALVKAEEVRMNRPTAFVQTIAPAPVVICQTEGGSC